MNALATAEQSNVTPGELTRLLHTCIDDLRLVIDSLDPIMNDLVTLMVTIRYRLGPQLDAAGLILDWDINDLPKLPWMEPSDALHMLRIVQEAFANILKHASATHIRVATRSVDGCIEITVADNGCGFDPVSATQGRGLRNLKRRSEQIGGRLQLLSDTGNGTSLILSLPVDRCQKLSS